MLRIRREQDQTEVVARDPVNRVHLDRCKGVQDSIKKTADALEQIIHHFPAVLFFQRIQPTRVDKDHAKFVLFGGEIFERFKHQRQGGKTRHAIKEQRAHRSARFGRKSI